MSIVLSAAVVVGIVNYPIVAIRSPRPDDATRTYWTEVFDPLNCEPGSDLVLIHVDGTEEILVSGGVGAVLDPCPSLDGKWIYYSHVHDKSDVNNRRFGGQLTRGGADIFKINVASREIVRLTNQEWTPNTGVARFTKDRQGKFDPINRDRRNGLFLDYGIYNLGPCPLPGGRVMFTSSRNGFKAPKGQSFPNMQLFVMDDDGRNVEQIGHFNLSSALHPVLLKNGRVMFSSWESQGLRDARMWGIWSINPDGCEWGPELSAFDYPNALHFHGQLTDGRLVVTRYYLSNNMGFGTFIAFHPANGVFGSNDATQNPPLARRFSSKLVKNPIPFSPLTATCLTPFANEHDTPAPVDQMGIPMGKVTHPSGGPNNDLLCVWSPGAVNVKSNLHGTKPHGHLAVISGGRTINHPAELEVIRVSKNHSYQQPKALVPYASIYGHDGVELRPLANDGSVHETLPKGTPYGLIGTSSFYKRDSAPARKNHNWIAQGADAGLYDNSEISAVRIVQQEPASHYLKQVGRGHPPLKRMRWYSQISERMKILGEIPLRKTGAPLDPDGNPDTSFLARIPADVPFTFQLLDDAGHVLVNSQTWHQVRPGEMRVNCGGCHAHSQPPTDFALTQAAKPGYVVNTYDSVTHVEFERDVLPILQSHCARCHDHNHESGLELDGSPKEVFEELREGSGGVSPGRYITTLRSRESVLMWKLRGRRLDGVPGDIHGDPMPPDAPRLSDEELRTIASWIDLGCAKGSGILLDDLRPTLTLQSPPRHQIGHVNAIIFGAIDTETGINESSISVVANWEINGIAAGMELSNLFSVANNIWTLRLSEPKADAGRVTVSVSDWQGNVSTTVRDFVVESTLAKPTPGAREPMSVIKSGEGK